MAKTRFLDRRLAAARSGSIHGAGLRARESDAAPAFLPRHAEQITEYPEQRHLRMGHYGSLVMVDLQPEPSHLELRDQDSPHSKSTAGEIPAILLDMEGKTSDFQHSLSAHISSADFVCRGNLLSTCSEPSQLFAAAIALFPANHWR